MNNRSTAVETMPAKRFSLGYVLFVALFTVPLIAVAIYMAAGVASANMEIRQAGYDAGVLGQGTTAPDSLPWSTRPSWSARSIDGVA